VHRLSVAVVLLLSLTLWGCDSSPRPLRVGTNVWPGYEPLYLARELGNLSDADVRLVELPSATDVMQALSLGHIEAGALTLDEVLTLMAEGDDLVVVLIFDISAGADVLMVRPDIHSLSDLAGKHLAVETSAAGALMLQAALQAGGLSLDQVHVIPSSQSDHMQAWKNKTIDAAVTYEPYATELGNAGAVRLFDSTAIKGQIVDVLAVQRSALKKHHGQLQQLTDAYFDALHEINVRPQGAYRIMNQRMKLPHDYVAYMFDGLELPDREQNLNMLRGNPSELESNARQLVNVMTSYELLQRHLFVNGISYPFLLEQHP